MCVRDWQDKNPSSHRLGISSQLCRVLDRRMLLFQVDELFVKEFAQPESMLTSDSISVIPQSMSRRCKEGDKMQVTRLDSDPARLQYTAIEKCPNPL